MITIITHAYGSIYGLPARWAVEPVRIETTEHNVGYGGYLVTTAYVERDGLRFRAQQNVIDGSWLLVGRTN